MNKYTGIRRQSKIRAAVAGDTKRTLKKFSKEVTKVVDLKNAEVRALSKFWGSQYARAVAAARYEARMYHLAHMIAKGRAYVEVESYTRKKLRHKDFVYIQGILNRAGFNFGYHALRGWETPVTNEDMVLYVTPAKEETTVVALQPAEQDI